MEDFFEKYTGRLIAGAGLAIILGTLVYQRWFTPEFFYLLGGGLISLGIIIGIEAWRNE